jgi:hypothetical protein
MNENDWKELIETPPHGHNHGRTRRVYQESGKYDWLTLETDGSFPSLKTYMDTSTVARNRVIRYLVAEGWSREEVMASFHVSRSTFYSAVQGYNEETEFV